VNIRKLAISRRIVLPGESKGRTLAALALCHSCPHD